MDLKYFIVYLTDHNRTIQKQFECLMGLFHVNYTFDRHLGCHLVSSELPKIASLGFVMYYVCSFKNAKTFSVDAIARFF